MARSLLAALLVAAAAGPAAAQTGKDFFLRDGQRVVFLGDSNTFAGHFITYLDGYLATRFPEKRFELLNLGLPSETVSGLSEEDHPYPRPDLHKRLDRLLAKTKPDLAVVCYGMNDGIYAPYTVERFEKFRDGIRRLLAKLDKAKVKVVLLTPAPFDPLPLKGKVQADGAEKYSWMRPHARYNAVLGRYTAWLMMWRDDGYNAVDTHGALFRFLTAARKADPDYVVSGDGIHPSPGGHWLVTQELLRAWNAPHEVDTAEIDAKAGKAVRGKVSNLSADGGTIAFDWVTRIPMPNDPRWDKMLHDIEKVNQRWNRHRLIVKGAAAARYTLYERGHKLGEVTREQLAAGVDLTAFPGLSTNRRAVELGRLVDRRQRLLGLAWLTDVGHDRPDTPKGLPLAEARRQAEELEDLIRMLAEPRPIRLRLVPAAD